MKLQIKDFRNHAEYTLDGTGIFALTGTNGVGKTAILEAVTAVLFGRDLSDGVGLSRCIRHGENEAIIRIEIDGKVIKRVIGPQTSAIEINGVEAKQGDLDALWGSRHNVVFGSVNPRYLLELPPKNKRELFMSVLPAMDKDKIFVKKYGKDLLEQFQLYDLKSARAKARQLRTSIEAYKMNISQFAMNVQTNEALLSEAMKGLMSKDALKIIEKDVKGQIVELEQDMEYLQGELRRMGNLENRRKDAQEDLARVVKEVKERITKGKLSEVLSEKSARRDKLNNLYKQLTREIVSTQTSLEMFQDSQEGKCVVCGQDISGDYIDEHVTELKGRLDDLNDKVVKVKKALEAEQQQVDELTRLADEGAVLKKEIEEINGAWNQYQKYKKELSDKENELSRLQESRDLELTERYQEHVKMKAKSEELARIIKVDEDSIAQAKAQVDKLEDELDDMRVIVEALSPAGVESEIIKEQTKTLVKVLRKYLPDASIETIQKNKSNDNYKEVFDVSWGKVGWKDLSNGERILTAIALSLSLRELGGVKLPLMLLDEMGALGMNNLRKVYSWVNGMDIVLTKATTNLHIQVKVTEVKPLKRLKDADKISKGKK